MNAALNFRKALRGDPYSLWVTIAVVVILRDLGHPTLAWWLAVDASLDAINVLQEWWHDRVRARVSA